LLGDESMPITDVSELLPVGPENRSSRRMFVGPARRTLQQSNGVLSLIRDTAPNSAMEPAALLDRARRGSSRGR
jgi:hypothetical protein